MHASPAGGIDERSWVEGIQAGDPAAFEALFRAYYQVLYEVALRYLRSHEDAEEVAQEVLCAVWERRRTWAPRGPLRPYLTTAARNRALNALYVTQRGETLVGREVVTAPPADAALSAGEWAAAVRAAIEDEPPRRRAVLALRWEHGLSYAEIAVVLGVTVRAVEQAHLRAMRALRERLASIE